MPAASSKSKKLRLIALAVLALLVALASLWLVGTEQGRQFLDRERLRSIGMSAHGWVERNPISFIVVFIATYIVCAVLLLPVWWLQILSGLAFGLWGILAVMVGSTCGALVTALVSQWLGEEYVHERVIGGGKVARRLKNAVDVLGRNGLLVVFICRLSYPIPYGISNYLFGLTGIRRRDIAIGTAFGGTPVYAGWVAAGARPDWISKWQFWTVVIGINFLLLMPLLIKSARARKLQNAAVSEASM